MLIKCELQTEVFGNAINTFFMVKHYKHALLLIYVKKTKQVEFEIVLLLLTNCSVKFIH